MIAETMPWRDAQVRRRIKDEVRRTKDEGEARMKGGGGAGGRDNGEAAPSPLQNQPGGGCETGKVQAGREDVFSTQRAQRNTKNTKSKGGFYRLFWLFPV